MSEIIKCHHCNQTVFVNSNRICPSCQKNIDDEFVFEISKTQKEYIPIYPYFRYLLLRPVYIIISTTIFFSIYCQIRPQENIIFSIFNIIMVSLFYVLIYVSHLAAKDKATNGTGFYKAYLNSWIELYYSVYVLLIWVHTSGPKEDIKDKLIDDNKQDKKD